MRSTTRLRVASAVLVAAGSRGGYAAVTSAVASAGAGRVATAHSAKAAGPSVKRFDLNGYVIVTDYSLGRNTGNTFRQTYKHSRVQGVPIKGPFVGTKF